MAIIPYYTILGVKRDASTDEIHHAYRRLAQICHPDKIGGERVLYDIIREAHDHLTDESTRKAYDKFMLWVSSKLKEKNNDSRGHRANDASNSDAEYVGKKDRCDLCNGYGYLLNRAFESRKECGWCKGNGWLPGRKF